MVGVLLIDGVDIREEYGIIVSEGSYNSLLSYPSLKQPVTIDWKEMDGVSVNLKNPILDKKEFSISFVGIQGSNVIGFFEMLHSKSYHVFDFVTLRFCKKLRVVEIHDYKGIDIFSFSLKLSDDFPIEDRNKVTNPNLNEIIHNAPFAIRTVYLVAGTDYIFSFESKITIAAQQLNVEIINVAEAEIICAFEVSEYHIEQRKVRFAKFTAPYTGEHTIQAYSFFEDAIGTLYSYELVEYGLPSFIRKPLEYFKGTTLQGYTVDNINLMQYGITLMDGSDAEIEKPRSTKQPQTINVLSVSGEISDSESIQTYKSKEVALKVLIQGYTMSNYNSFLYDITQPCEHVFYSPETNKDYSFYYKSCVVTKVAFSREVWWIMFNLTLEFLREYEH